MAAASSEKDSVVKELGRPREIDFLHEREYHWPAWKFGMAMDELWGELHDQYNTLRIPIQCQRAFHLDVKELATKASTRKQFFRLMDERSQDRFKEVKQAIADISIDFIGDPGRFVIEGLWSPFLDFARATSAADLIIFLSNLEKPEETPEAKTAAPTLLASLLAPDPSPRDALAQTVAPTPPAYPPPVSNPLSYKKTRCRGQTIDKIVRYNLRPRPAGTSQRKEQLRKSPRRKRN
ncbi:hypothetical protein F4860DRAFT_54026 [Xylaria cubensis]|nr:hypothetical protein F4860DRAFT_54026 [Xylaria cubensis]